jgi:hypothetical protein
MTLPAEFHCPIKGYALLKFGHILQQGDCFRLELNRLCDLFKASLEVALQNDPSILTLANQSINRYVWRVQPVVQHLRDGAGQGVAITQTGDARNRLDEGLQLEESIVSKAGAPMIGQQRQALTLEKGDFCQAIPRFQG